jgi:hypothetical protein
MLNRVCSPAALARDLHACTATACAVQDHADQGLSVMVPATQIYNENIQELLAPAGPQGQRPCLRLKEDKAGHMCVVGAQQVGGLRGYIVFQHITRHVVDAHHNMHQPHPISGKCVVQHARPPQAVAGQWNGWRLGVLAPVHNATEAIPWSHIATTYAFFYCYGMD